MGVADRLEFLAARALTALPPRVQWQLSGRAPLRIDGQQLSSELQVLLALQKRKAAPGLSDLPPVLGRERLRRDAMLFGGDPLPLDGVRDLVIDADGRRLRARHYRARRRRAPLVVFFHGGGFVLGDLDSHDAPCRWLCKHGDVDVLSIEYRLAPEHPFPAAVEDAIAAYRWARANASQLGADARRVAVAGDSAGANLSAVVAQATRDEDGPSLQLLFYPAVDRSTVRPSLELFADGFVLTRKDIDWFSSHYFGTQPLDDHPHYAPIRGTLANLAPAIVVTAGFDPLRDEGEAYAQAMSQAGTPVTLRRFDELVHGFVNLVGVSNDCRRAMREVAQLLRHQLR